MYEDRNNDDMLSLEFDRVEMAMYSKITANVVSLFNLETAGEKTEGLAEVFQDFKQGEKIIGLEWDNWTGYIVIAKNDSAQQLAKEIGHYVGTNYNA